MESSAASAAGDMLLIVAAGREDARRRLRGRSRARRGGRSWRGCEKQSGAARGGLSVFGKHRVGEVERTHNLAPVICSPGRFNVGFLRGAVNYWLGITV